VNRSPAFAWLAAPALALSLSAAAAVPAPDAETLTERMLSALGGRAAWAKAKNTVNDSRQDWDGEPSELRVVITMDFERPRLRIETRGRGLELVRVLDGDRSWRLSREGTIEEVSAATVADDRRFYAGHVYRTLHRLAARDPRLTTSVGKEGRLEVFESGARIAWYALDRGNQPYLFGAHGDETGSIFGPWEHEQSGIRHPAWVTREAGKWRAMLKRLEVNVPLTEAMFARPATPAEALSPGR
jgi:hypothetical protein